MGLTSTFKASYAGSQTSAKDLGTASFPAALATTISLASGTASGQADLLFSDSRTIAASGTEDLDLAGSLVDGLGTTLTFAKLKAVLITADSGNTNDVQLTRPASNGAPLFMAAGDGIAIKPGGAFLWVAPGAGVTVTAGTGDLLTVTNSAGTTGVTYSVIIVGTSA